MAVPQTQPAIFDVRNIRKQNRLEKIGTHSRNIPALPEVPILQHIFSGGYSGGILQLFSGLKYCDAMHFNLCGKRHLPPGNGTIVSRKTSFPKEVRRTQCIFISDTEGAEPNPIYMLTKTEIRWNNFLFLEKSSDHKKIIWRFYLKKTKKTYICTLIETRKMLQISLWP